MLAREEVELKSKECKELTDDNTLIRDEYNSLNLAYEMLEKKYTTLRVTLVTIN